MRSIFRVIGAMIVVIFLISSAMVVLATGMVRADNVPSLPGAPTGLTATPGANQVSLTWTAPVSNGGAAIDYYVVYCETDVSMFGQEYVADPSYPVNQTVLRVGVDLPADQPILNAAITGIEFRGRSLDYNWTYNFTVAAHNSAGMGPKSGSVIADPYTVPLDVILNVEPRDGGAFLGWGFNHEWNLDGGSPILYYIVYQDGVDIMHTDADNVTVTGLTNGHAYNYSVAAHNAAGNGTRYDSMVVPMPRPDVPTGLIATPGDGKVSLAWKAPDNSGESFIDTYIVYQDGVWAESTYNKSTSTTITGLTNGQTYLFAVSAQNQAGEGSRSSNVSVTPGIKNSSEPTGLVATAGDGRVALSWSSPDLDGGASIDYYAVFQNGTDIKHVRGNSAVITGLTNGRSYTFGVAAHNGAGTSHRSDSVDAIPYTLPGAPKGLTAVPGDKEVTLNWTSPENDGGRAVDYFIVYQDGAALPDHPTGNSMVIDGLVNSQAYSFNISAHNQAGIGPRSRTETATPLHAPTMPGVPTGLLAMPGDSQVNITWTAPTGDSGASVDFYIVYQDGVDVVHPSTNSTTVSGLNNGQAYEFQVAAHNSVGLGPGSVPVQAIPSTVPGTPNGLNAAAGNGQVSLNWSAPSTDGGAAIDYYVIYQNGTDVAHSNSTGMTVTGLPNGESYGFAVASHNVAGVGSPTSSVTAIPGSGAKSPGVPTNLTAAPGNGSAKLSWTAPTDSSSIDYYIVFQNGADVSHTSATSTTVTGLTNGENYTFTVAAHNSGGVGTPSPAQKVRPGAPLSSSGTAMLETDNMVIYAGGLAVLAFAIIALFLTVGRRKKV